MGAWRWKSAHSGNDDIPKLTIVTGGGPGVMEAANRGAGDAGKNSVGLNIVLPEEQESNRYITPSLCFQFHYFAIRKLHFLLRCKAMVVFPGGFGTLDELFEAIDAEYAKNSNFDFTCLIKAFSKSNFLFFKFGFSFFIKGSVAPNVNSLKDSEPLENEFVKYSDPSSINGPRKLVKSYPKLNATRGLSGNFSN